MPARPNKLSPTRPASASTCRYSLWAKWAKCPDARPIDRRMSRASGPTPISGEVRHWASAADHSYPRTRVLAGSRRSAISLWSATTASTRATTEVPATTTTTRRSIFSGLLRGGTTPANTTRTTTTPSTTGCRVLPNEVATSSSPAITPSTTGRTACFREPSGIKGRATRPARAAPRLSDATRPAAIRQISTRGQRDRRSRPIPTSSAIAMSEPAAFEYVSVAAARHRLWSGMASGYQRSATATKPAPAVAAPSTASPSAADSRFSVARPRMAKNTARNPTMLAPSGKNDMGW